MVRESFFYRLSRAAAYFLTRMSPEVFEEIVVDSPEYKEMKKMLIEQEAFREYSERERRGLVEKLDLLSEEYKRLIFFSITGQVRNIESLKRISDLEKENNGLKGLVGHVKDRVRRDRKEISDFFSEFFKIGRLEKEPVMLVNSSGSPYFTSSYISKNIPGFKDVNIKRYFDCSSPGEHDFEWRKIKYRAYVIPLPLVNSETKRDFSNYSAVYVLPLRKKGTVKDRYLEKYLRKKIEEVTELMGNAFNKMKIGLEET